MALIDQIRGGTKKREPLAEDDVAAIQEDLKSIRIALKTMEEKTSGVLFHRIVQQDLESIRITLKTMEEKTFGVLFHRIVTALSGGTSIVGGYVACAVASESRRVSTFSGSYLQSWDNPKIALPIAFGIVCIAIGCYLLSKLALPWRH